MAKWRGNLTDLLTEEQRKKIDEHLSVTPSDLFIDRRDAKLNRYPARLWDSESAHTARNLIASERPVSRSRDHVDLEPTYPPGGTRDS